MLSYNICLYLSLLNIISTFIHIAASGIISIFLLTNIKLHIYMCVIYIYAHICFPDSSVGKESACNAGDPGGLIPGSGISAIAGIGYPLQYSWASLVAQLVKNSPTMQETWDQSLGWEDALEKERLLHLVIFSLSILISMDI